MQLMINGCDVFAQEVVQVHLPGGGIIGALRLLLMWNKGTVARPWAYSADMLPASRTDPQIPKDDSLYAISAVHGNSPGKGTASAS